MKSLIVAAAMLSFSAFAAKVEINVTNVAGKSGKVFFAVLDDPKQFPDGKNIASGSVAVDGKQDAVKIVIDLPAGSYATSTFLDVNGNSKLDKRLGIPSEKFGFSNNPKLQFGPPSFSECEFRVGEGQKNSISIKVKPFKDHIGV